MKSIAKPFTPAPPEQKVPCLKKRKGMHLIVLFNNETSGMIVYGDRVGNYSKLWSDLKDNWEDYHGEITLSSE